MTVVVVPAIPVRAPEHSPLCPRSAELDILLELLQLVRHRRLLPRRDHLAGPLAELPELFHAYSQVVVGSRCSLSGRASSSVQVKAVRPVERSMARSNIVKGNEEMTAVSNQNRATSALAYLSASHAARLTWRWVRITRCLEAICGVTARSKGTMIRCELDVAIVGRRFRPGA